MTSVLRHPILEDATKERDPRFTGQIFKIQEILWENAQPGHPLYLGLNESSPPGYAAFFQLNNGTWEKVGEVQVERPYIEETKRNPNLKGQEGVSEMLSGVDVEAAFEMARNHRDPEQNFERIDASEATLKPNFRRDASEPEVTPLPSTFDPDDQIMNPFMLKGDGTLISETPTNNPYDDESILRRGWEVKFENPEGDRIWVHQNYPFFYTTDQVCEIIDKELSGEPVTMLDEDHRVPEADIKGLAAFFAAGIASKSQEGITPGESGPYRPGSVGVDPEGEQGYGLWDIESLPVCSCEHTTKAPIYHDHDCPVYQRYCPEPYEFARHNVTPAVMDRVEKALNDYMVENDFQKLRANEMAGIAIRALLITDES